MYKQKEKELNDCIKDLSRTVNAADKSLSMHSATEEIMGAAANGSSVATAAATTAAAAAASSSSSSATTSSSSGGMSLDVQASSGSRFAQHMQGGRARYLA